MIQILAYSPTPANDHEPARRNPPHYHVCREGKGWAVARVDQLTWIGRYRTRGAALQSARLLAGWRGTVTMDSSR